MSVSSALNAGVAGLTVNAAKLSTISDNIANSGTTGYKRADTSFQSLVGSSSSGGFVAGGVRATTYREVSSQGAIVSTGNPTDITVRGRGLIPVTTLSGISASPSSRPLQLTTTGSFNVDSNGNLRTAGGLFLMGWPANPDGSIAVPGRDSAIGLEPVQLDSALFASDPTTEISLGLNLPATATVADGSGVAGTGDPLSFPVQYIDSLGLAQTLTFTFTPTLPATGRSDQWAVSITDSATPDAAGDPSVVATFDVQFDASAASGGSILASGITAVTGGALGAGNVLTVPVGGGNSIEIDLGPDGNSNLTQLAADFAPVAVTKNGNPIGSVDRFEVTEDGFLQAVYDTGFRLTTYQIPLADVRNPDGLRAEDNSAFSLTQESGDVFFWDAGTGPVGSTIGFALEESTTDIAAELTDLIQTQRAYSSNAKIIQTVDEVLQETTNIIR